MDNDLLEIMISLPWSELLDTSIDATKEINDDNAISCIVISIFENSHIDEKKKILNKAKEIYMDNYGEEFNE